MFIKGENEHSLPPICLSADAPSATKPALTDSFAVSTTDQWLVPSG